MHQPFPVHVVHGHQNLFKNGSSILVLHHFRSIENDLKQIFVLAQFHLDVRDITIFCQYHMLTSLLSGLFYQSVLAHAIVPHDMLVVKFLDFYVLLFKPFPYYRVYSSICWQEDLHSP